MEPNASRGLISGPSIDPKSRPYLCGDGTQGRGDIGFAAGNNYLARAAKGRWLLLLNPDTRAYPGAIDQLISAGDANPDFKVLGGVTVDRCGTRLEVSELHRPTLGRLIRRLLRIKPLAKAGGPGNGPFAAEAVSGGFMLIDHAAWMALGGLDERFFHYAEELDFCARIADAEGRIGFVPEARVYHDVGSGNSHSPARLLYLLRGTATYYRKHFSAPVACACLLVDWLVCAQQFAGSIVLSPVSRRYRRISSSWRDAALRPWLWLGGY